MKGVVLFLLISLILTQHSPAQWENRNNGLPGWSVADAIDASDSSTAVISIRSDLAESMYITKDAGLNWEAISIPYEWAVIDVALTDTNNIWFTSSDGKIYGSSNGGKDWVLQFNDSAQTHFMNYIEMFDADNGVAMGDAPLTDDHLFKDVFQRLRPCHEPALESVVNIVNGKCGGSYGFYSSHASNVFAIAVFVVSLYKRHCPSLFLGIFLWAGLIAYSRIYLGVHYPGDVIAGAIAGGILGYFTARFLKNLLKRPAIAQ